MKENAVRVVVLGVSFLFFTFGCAQDPPLRQTPQPIQPLASEPVAPKNPATAEKEIQQVIKVAAPVDAGSAGDGDPVELSEKAATLKIGIARHEVIALLGLPTWALLPKDAKHSELAPLGPTAVVLFWTNGKCSPVEVSFDVNLRANGWDEGRSCAPATTKIMTDELKKRRAFSCKRKSRRKYCKPARIR